MVQTAEGKQVCRAASSLLYPELEFEVKPCGEYTTDDFEEVLCRSVFNHNLANAGGKTLQLDRKEGVDVTSTARNPLAKSLLFCETSRRTPSLISSMASKTSCLRSFGPSDDCPRLSMLPSISTSGAITVLLTDHVITAYPDLGASKAFSFATLCIVAPHVRFTLAVLPMEATDHRAKRDAVRTLFKTVREYVSLRHVYLDRGFYRVNVVAELERLGVDYIVGARPGSGMQARRSAGAERSPRRTRCNGNTSKRRRSMSQSSRCPIAPPTTSTPDS